MRARFEQLAGVERLYSPEERDLLNQTYATLDALAASRTQFVAPTHLGSLQDLLAATAQDNFDPAQFGRVTHATNGDLIQFYVSDAATVPNAFERLCRGLILNRATLQVVARPFDVFHVYTPGGGLPDDVPLPTVTPYVSGGRGGFIYQHENEVYVGTSQAIVDDRLTDWLRPVLADRAHLLPRQATVLLEFVGEGAAVSRAVVLAVRNHWDGGYKPPSARKRLADQLGLDALPTLSSKTPRELLVQAADPQTPDAGFVAVDERRQQWLIFPQTEGATP